LAYKNLSLSKFLGQNALHKICCSHSLSLSLRE